jgi:probable HAF family extracellular repeat protein
MSRTRYRSGALLAALAACLPASALVPAPPSYITHVIPVPTHASVQPTAINDQGQVTGSLVLANQPAHAFLYGPGGAVTDIGTLPYPGSTTQGAASGQAINDEGVVVGTYADPVAQAWSFGFLYENGRMTALSRASGYTNCSATGVNAMVMIVGGCATLDNAFAALYQSGVPQPLGPAGGSASGVNGYGQVAASSMVSGFLYVNGAITNIPALKTIAAPAPPATPTALNNAGQVVGWESDNGNFAAFIYSYSTATTQALAGVPESTVQPVIAINNAGQVVGATTVVDSGTVVPYFIAAGTLTDINSLISPDDPNRGFVTITNAYAINDAGWILATGFDNRTQASGAYVLIPSTPFGTSVAVEAPAAAVTGTAFTVAWTDQSATSCTASGGSGTDGWTGKVATRGGQQTVTESAAGTYSFTLSCSGSSGSAVKASTKVVVATSVMPGFSGGGSGSLDAGTLAMMLLALAALRGMPGLRTERVRRVIALR